MIQGLNFLLDESEKSKENKQHEREDGSLNIPFTGSVRFPCESISDSYEL